MNAKEKLDHLSKLAEARDEFLVEASTIKEIAHWVRGLEFELLMTREVVREAYKVLEREK